VLLSVGTQQGHQSLSHAIFSGTLGTLLYHLLEAQHPENVFILNGVSQTYVKLFQQRKRGHSGHEQGRQRHGSLSVLGVAGQNETNTTELLDSEGK